MEDLFSLLRQNSYPGRGILLGRSADGGFGVMAYFIMGRSENSRNRVFCATKDGIRTRAFDDSKMTDPSLVIYTPVRESGRGTIVTNGDQTDTVCDFLTQGKSFEDALRTRSFEPDAPNFTPRISGLMEPEGGYRLSILKTDEGNPAQCLRFFYEYPAPIAGRGHLIHTYRHDGSPLPSFAGEPVPVAVTGGLTAFAEALWQSLDPNNRVSLFVRFIPLKGGRPESVIINALGQEHRILF